MEIHSEEAKHVVPQIGYRKISYTVNWTAVFLFGAILVIKSYDCIDDVFATTFEIRYRGDVYTMFDARRMNRNFTDSVMDAFKLWPRGSILSDIPKKEQHETYYCSPGPGEW